ncbi:multidrug efflux MFS transporter [Acidiferrimicrobium sp. IK]|uniref:MDR family MFS transporter n=1 Tax=Acidiferrimicrobium sp. IK TaxID=2871700 RepID=UPI0021CAF7D5|nr:MDR family MFS transporter [Acidiferrimicrobium sp. IK]MCU4183666.1 multidrug efflux MFS transporter [Acidiferrimicrobium sp. IK]
MPQRTINQKVAVSVVYVAAMFMAIMDTTIVNVALPTITKDLHSSPASVAATVIAFLVSLAVFIPASSWLGDRLGARRVLLGAIVIFTAASALCGLASSLGELVVFRVLQGVGGGLMTPVGLAMLFRVFPPAERVKASALLILPTALAPALGPVLGGLFVTDLSWRWVFYVNVPIGTVAVIFGLVFLAEQRPPSVGRFDLPGFVTSGLGLGLLMYGVSEGPNIGWRTGRVVVSIIVGTVLLLGMVVVELRTERPMLDLRLYTDRLFRSTALVMTLGSTSFLGVLYLLALFFQEALHMTALQAGLSIFPEALGVMMGSQLVSRILYPSFGPRRIMAAGLVVVAGVMLLLSQVTTGTDLWLVRVVVFFLGAGMSGVFLPSQAAAFASLPREKTGDASTVFNAQRQLGGAIGVAVLTTVITTLHPLHLVAGRAVANLHAYHVGFVVAAGIALLAGVAALTVSDADAASTIVPRKRKAEAATSTSEPVAAA